MFINFLVILSVDSSMFLFYLGYGKVYVLSISLSFSVGVVRE